MHKASEKIINLKMRERNLRDFLNYWTHCYEKKQKLRTIIQGKIKRDSRNSTSLALDDWKHFIILIDMVAKADVFHSKVIRPRIWKNLFLKWRYLFLKI